MFEHTQLLRYQIEALIGGDKTMHLQQSEHARLASWLQLPNAGPETAVEFRGETWNLEAVVVAAGIKGDRVGFILYYTIHLLTVSTAEVFNGGTTKSPFIQR